MPTTTIVRKSLVAALRASRSSQLIAPAAASADSDVDAKRREIADLCRYFGERIHPETRRATTAAMPAVADEKMTVGPAGASEVKLSKRLRETLGCLLVGDSEKQIALKLQLSQHTVHVYVKALHKAFDVSSRGELLARFVSVPK